MQHCDATCTWCANNFFRWLKSRMAQMSRPNSKAGDTTLFAVAAASRVASANS